MLITSEQEELEKVEDEEDGMEFNSFKYEYVHEEAIKVNSFDRENNSFPFGEIGLGQVLLSCICSSTDDSCAMRYEEDIHRGVRAGNRFDITIIYQFKLVDGEKE